MRNDRRCSGAAGFTARFLFWINKGVPAPRSLAATAWVASPPLPKTRAKRRSVVSQWPTGAFLTHPGGHPRSGCHAGRHSRSSCSSRLAKAAKSSSRPATVIAVSDSSATVQVVNRRSAKSCGPTPGGSWHPNFQGFT